MRTVISFLLCYCSLLLTGQISSESQQKLTNQYFDLYEKLTDFHYSNLDSAEFYSNKLLKLSTANGDSIWIAAAYEGIGYVFFYRDQLEKSLPYFEKQRDILLENAEKADVGLAYMNIGNVYSGMARYDLGIQNYLKASSLLPEVEEYDIDRAYLNYNLANTLLDFEDIKNVWKYLNTAQAHAKKHEIEDLYASILNLFAELALREGKPDRAIALADSSLEISILNNDLIEESYALELKARSSLQLGDRDLAIKLQKESLNKAEIYGDPYLSILANSWMAEVYLRSDSIKQAVYFAEKAYETRNEQHSLIGKKRAAEVYAMVLGEIENYQKQASILTEYIGYKDSLYQTNLNESILEAQNETFAENNALLKQTSGLQKTIIDRNNLIRLILITALTLLVILVLVIGNISRKRNVANRKLLLNQSLLDEKSQALEQLNLQLKNLNQGKDKLLSILTHDIKQPFNQTLGVLELLDIYTDGNKELYTVLKQVRESVENDKKTVENLLIWSKSQFTKISAQPAEVDCNEVTFKIINELKTSLQVKEIDVSVDITKESRLIADPYHLEIILRNLITNAVKFSHKGGKLKIYAKRKEELIEIAIQDEGVGMSKNDLNQLFDQNRHFSEKGTLNEAGTGLGMLIVYDFVKENNGDIEVDSSPKKGSTFRLRFPAA